VTEIVNAPLQPLRSLPGLLLTLGLLIGCSAPLRVIEDPTDLRVVGERPPGTPLATDDDSALPKLPPTLQSARQRLLGIAALVANYSLVERRVPELLQHATQALREESGSSTAPEPQRGDRVTSQLDAALTARWKAGRWTSEDDLVATGARGMLAGLPTGTTYFRRQEAILHALRVPEEMFGVRLGMAVPYPVILSVEEGSSAALAFISPGEEVTDISGQPTSGKSLGELYEQLALEREDVTLGLRSGPEYNRRVVLRRSSLALKSALQCRLLDRKVLYLKPGQIGPGSAGQAREAAVSAGDMAARVILDLRESTGGYLDSGVALVDQFLERGRIVEMRMRDKVIRWNARPGDPLERSATVVLVGSRTEETAIMVAAVLQSLKRVTTLGDPTTEDTHVTTWFWLKGGGALRLTVAEVMLGSSPLPRVVPDPLPPRAPLSEQAIDDTPCPGSGESGAVASDPLVARAVRFLAEPSTAR